MSGHYTGIGSRETPPEIIDKMNAVAGFCASLDIILRSGAADGADTAFEDFCAGKKEIFLPWNNFNDRSVRDDGIYVRGNDVNSRDIAATIHPVFYRLGRGAQALHTRNVNQVLGKDASNPDPSLFVIYYAPRTRSGKVQGGTATAVTLAEREGIPCWNFFDNQDLDELKEWIYSIINKG